MAGMKQELAVALFRSVTGDPEASWGTMSSEERDDALQWAGDALEVLREPNEAMADAGVVLRDGRVSAIYRAMIDAAAQEPVDGK